MGKTYLGNSESGKYAGDSNTVKPISPLVTDEMINLMPEEAFTPDKVFMDICVKHGEFLISVKKRLMNSAYMKEAFPDEEERLDHIEKYQLFGIAYNEACYWTSKANLYGYASKYDNIALIKIYEDNGVLKPDEYLERTYKNVALARDGGKTFKRYIIDRLIESLKRNEEENKDILERVNHSMKINTIVGNPPYNSDSYIDFVIQAHEIAEDYVCMITPAKWQAKAGRKNEEFREKIVPYISDIVYYPDCLDIFGIQDASGISYYLIKNVKQDKCRVTNKCVLQSKLNSTEIRDITHEQTLWNIGNQVVEKLKLSGATTYDFSSVSERKTYTVNVNKQLNISTGSSGVWDWENSCIKDEYIGHGGVLFNQNGNLNVIGKVTLITPTSDDSSGTSIDLFTSDNLDECKSFYSWINTKFVRFLILINIGSLTMMNERGWRFVPDPGEFNHIFTDEELYKKYSLTEKEIDIIESVIKSR